VGGKTLCKVFTLPMLMLVIETLKRVPEVGGEINLESVVHHRRGREYLHEAQT